MQKGIVFLRIFLSLMIICFFDYLSRPRSKEATCWIERGFVSEMEGSYMWRVRVEKDDSLVFERKFGSDSILRIEQFLFFAKNRQIPISNVVFGKELDEGIFFSFETPDTVKESELREVLYASGF